MYDQQHKTLGSVELSRLFLQQIVAYLYKAEFFYVVIRYKKGITQ